MVFGASAGSGAPPPSLFTWDSGFARPGRAGVFEVGGWSERSGLRGIVRLRMCHQISELRPSCRWLLGPDVDDIEQGSSRAAPSQDLTAVSHDPERS